MKTFMWECKSMRCNLPLIGMRHVSVRHAQVSRGRTNDEVRDPLRIKWLQRYENLHARIDTRTHCL